ncbi:hypothetical protein ACVW0W_002868 [Bradyrhizobium sp. USDA 4469]
MACPNLIAMVPLGHSVTVSRIERGEVLVFLEFKREPLNELFRWVLSFKPKPFIPILRVELDIILANFDTLRSNVFEALRD